MIALSLGWGVQSFGLAAMVALGELPPVDVAIHADTTHERTATYEFAARWTPWLEEHGVRVVTVRAPNTDPVRDYGHGKKGVVTIPAFTTSPNNGAIQRQCTADWKIDPIKRWLQANRDRQPIEQWIGISLDEITRMKPSNVKYITHRWPLIEKGLRRAQVAQWLLDHGLELPPRSACVFCPYQSRKEWRALQGTEDWQHAVEVDESIRKARPPYDLFVHATMKPLPMVDFRSEQERGQLELWDNECSGMCGI